MMLPPGYEVHPTAPGYMWCRANNDVRLIPVGVPSAPGPTGPPAMPPMDPRALTGAYGGLDPKLVEDEYKRANDAVSGVRGDEDHFFIDWPKPPPGAPTKGAEVELVTRLLPRAQSAPTPWAIVRRHRLFADLFTKPPPNRQIINVDCLDSPHGPGSCPICDVEGDSKKSSNEAAQSMAEHFAGKVRVYWPALDLNDINGHWVQQKDATGTPVLDPATNQPAWKMIPGIVAMSQSLHLSILTFIREKGDPTDPYHGYPMKLRRKKTGDRDMDVEYYAMDMLQLKGPIDPSAQYVLANLIDFYQKNVIRFRKREELLEVADRIRAKTGLVRGSVSVPSTTPAGGYAPPAAAPQGASLQPPWQLHPQAPGYAWNPQTNAVLPVAQVPQAAPPPPPPPAAAPPPPYAAPPAAYAPPQGAPPAPPGYPTYAPQTAVPPGYALPPPVAPGMPPAPPGAAPGLPPPPPTYAAPPGPPPGPPVGYAPPGYPPQAPQPGPGMPPGVAPQLTAPPPPSAQPGVLSPAALEAALAGVAPPAPPGGYPPPPPRNPSDIIPF